MAKTYYESSLWSPQESWRTIRNIRAAAPEPVRIVLEKRDRADVFHMALEQSEQLFKSAAAVGRESRPIMLFYGLSQAGRALAAASSALGASEWTASGHGLKTSLGQVTAADIWRLPTAVQGGQSDLFSRVSLALGSAGDIDSVQLGAAAVNVVEFTHEFSDFQDFPRLLQPGSVAVLDSWWAGGRAEPVKFPLKVDASEDLESLLGSVPALSGFNFWRTDQGAPERDHNDHVLVAVPVQEIDVHGRQGTLRSCQIYRGHSILIRALGGGTTPVHPLLVWWLILYPLSMLARYDPRKWQQVLDIRASRTWSQIEYLTDRALDAVPQLLAETLQTLNSEAP